jgi:hypothetical protein
MTQSEIDFVSLTGVEAVDQRRILRLAAAAMEDDFTQLTAISAEIALDSRGSDIAIWSVLVGLSVAYARELSKDLGAAGALGAVRFALLADAAGESNG